MSRDPCQETHVLFDSQQDLRDEENNAATDDSTTPTLPHPKKRLQWADESGLDLEQVVLIPRRRSTKKKSASIRRSSRGNTTRRSKRATANSHAYLLAIAFCTFMSFSIVQMVVAIIAQSQSLVGDSAIMIVDSLTYLFNWIAEVRKVRYEQEEDEQQQQQEMPLEQQQERKALQDRTKRKIVLQMEIFPPVVSMLSLLVVISFLFTRSIRALRAVEQGDNNEGQQPNVQIMLGFAFFNLLLDVLNFTCFTRARNLFGLPAFLFSSSNNQNNSSNSNNDDGNNNNNNSNNTLNPTSSASLDGTETTDILVNCDVTKVDRDEEEKEPEQMNTMERCDAQNLNNEACATSSRQLRKRTNQHHDETNEENVAENTSTLDQEEKKEHGPANLNMCSAFTHVLADMLRSIAVIIAAIVAKAAPHVSPEIADGSAALVVYVLIFVSIVPLIRGLCRLVPEYRAILAQERTEEKAAGRGDVEIAMELSALWNIR